jgi:hypothetical protein
MLEPGANVDRGMTVVRLAPDWFDDLAALFRTGTETRWCWSLYRGSLPLYLRADFAEVARVPVPPGAIRVIVRRELA